MAAKPVDRSRTWPRTPLLPNSNVDGCAQAQAVIVSTSRLTASSPMPLVPRPRMQYQNAVNTQNIRAIPTSPRGPTTSSW